MSLLKSYTINELFRCNIYEKYWKTKKGKVLYVNTWAMVARMTTSRPSLGRPIIFASSRLCSFFRSRRFLCRETTAEAMFTALEIPPPCPAAKLNVVRALPSQFRFYRLPYNLGLPNRQLPSLSIRAQSLSDPSTSSRYTDTIGTSSPAFLQFPQCTLTQRHILVLNVVACAVIHSF